MKINPLGDRQSFYNDFIASCQKTFGDQGGRRCLSTEEDRIEMTLRQPQSMQNYTEVGFTKLRAPEKLFALIREFWERNKDNGKPEEWGIANTYTNNWQSASEMISVEDSGLRGGGQ
jgi:prolyl 4-hydroxylase